MAEIIELIAADHLHIMRWQVRLAELRHRRGEPGHAPALAFTWNTLASLIDLHMAADEEVCGPAIYGTGRMAGTWPGKQGTRAGTSTRSSARPATIRPGSALWWALVTAAGSLARSWAWRAASRGIQVSMSLAVTRRLTNGPFRWAGAPVRRASCLKVRSRPADQPYHWWTAR